MKQLTSLSAVTVAALVVVLAVCLPTVAVGQGPVLKPEPEYQLLGHWVGTWRMEGQQFHSPLGAAGKISVTLTCSVFSGGFHVVCNGDGTIGGGPYRELALFGYDPEERSYTWLAIDSTGMNGLARGSAKAGTWTFLFEMKTGGQPLKAKVTMVEQSPTVITVKTEVSVAGAPWLPHNDATLTKRK